MIIYCIEDINDLKYVGKTKQKLEYRHSNHICDKYRNNGCSSAKLHLDHSIIYPLEECDEEVSKEREQYWINKIDCVNKNKLNGENKENTRKKTDEWCKNNKEWIKERDGERYIKKKEEILKRTKEWSKNNRDRINARRRELRKLKKDQSKIKSTE